MNKVYLLFISLSLTNTYLCNKGGKGAYLVKVVHEKVLISKK